MHLFLLACLGVAGVWLVAVKGVYKCLSYCCLVTGNHSAKSLTEKTHRYNQCMVELQPSPRSPYQPKSSVSTHSDKECWNVSGGFFLPWHSFVWYVGMHYLDQLRVTNLVNQLYLWIYAMPSIIFGTLDENRGGGI